jgi:hypothetical protein
MRYAARLNVVYEFRGSTLTCTPDQLPVLANGQCPITSGDQVLALYGFDASASAEAVNWALVAALPILYRVIAFLALKYNRNAFAA